MYIINAFKEYIKENTNDLFFLKLLDDYKLKSIDEVELIRETNRLLGLKSMVVKSNKGYRFKVIGINKPGYGELIIV